MIRAMTVCTTTTGTAPSPMSPNRRALDKLSGKSMSAVWIDYDDDGWMDLFVTNDTMPNFLLHNNRDGTFTDRAICGRSRA